MDHDIFVKLLPSPENEAAVTAPENEPVPAETEVEKLPTVPDTLLEDIIELHQIVAPTPNPPAT